MAITIRTKPERVPLPEIDEEVWVELRPHLSVEQSAAMFADMDAGVMARDSYSLNLRLMQEYIVDWGGLVDEAGDAYACTPENIGALDAQSKLYETILEKVRDRFVEERIPGEGQLPTT